MKLWKVIWDSLSIPDYLEAEIKQSSVTAWASFVCRDMSVRNLVSEAHESSWEGRCHISYGSISSSLSTPPPENFRMEIHVTDILTLRDLEAYSHNMWSAGFIINGKGVDRSLCLNKAIYWMHTLRQFTKIEPNKGTTSFASLRPPWQVLDVALPFPPDAGALWLECKHIFSDEAVVSHWLIIKIVLPVNCGQLNLVQRWEPARVDFVTKSRI